MKNNTDKIIKVNAYSGYRANEMPLSFSFGDHKIEIIIMQSTISIQLSAEFSKINWPTVDRQQLIASS